MTFLLEVYGIFWIEPGYSKIVVKKKKSIVFGAQLLDLNSFSIHFIFQ